MDTHLPHLPHHPFTGRQAVGIVGGRPVWPVMGGADDAPDAGAAGPAGGGTEPAAAAPPAAERPDGVSEQEWAALGDPGRRAIERERRNARDERRQREQAERERDEARRATRSPEPPKPGQQQPDIAALIQQGIDAALRPVLQQQAATAAERIRDRAQSLAASVLHNPADAAVHLDLSSMVTAAGDPDEQAIRDGLARLIEERPYLARPVDGRRAADGSGQGAGSSVGLTLQQRVQEQLDLMKTS